MRTFIFRLLCVTAVTASVILPFSCKNTVLGGSGDASSLKVITTFSFSGVSATAAIDQTQRTITLVLPFGTDPKTLTPIFMASAGASVSCGGVILRSNSGTLDCSGGSLKLTVTAEDSSSQDYTLAVSVAASDEKRIVSFAFDSVGVTGVVDEMAHTIALKVPYTTNVTQLLPNILIAGSNVSPASGTLRDFSAPVTYTVTAADGSMQDYTVTISKQAAITSFSFPGSTYSIDHGARTIVLTVPAFEAFNAAVASFACSDSGSTITVGSTVQTSGTTVNDFSSPLVYTIHESDGGTVAYTVSVTPLAPAWTSLTDSSWSTSATPTTFCFKPYVVGSTIYLTTDNGLWISRDSGTTWEGNAGHTAGHLADNVIDGLAVSGSYVYAGFSVGSQGGVDLSTDGGATWPYDDTAMISYTYSTTVKNVGDIVISGGTVYVGINNAGLKGYLFSASLGTSNFNSSGTQKSIDRIAIQPNGTTIYEATTGGSLYVSTDTGATWSAARSIIAPGVAAAIGPYRMYYNDGKLYACSTTVQASGINGGLYISSDDGVSWPTLLFPGEMVHDVAFNGNIVVVASDAGVRISWDKGATLGSSTTTLTNNVYGLCFDGNKLYVSSVGSVSVGE